jgi:uncharacterized protein
MTDAKKTTNRLAGESSPYLLQHAHNPVDWHPWGDEAFDRARRESKPVFLSIGYSSCHWCHVMERESFENETIARVLNDQYVAVKVDREERPDIDQVYMQYVLATTGSGGWPLSVWLTPNLEPFLGGTYFPPVDRWGRPGFLQILRRIAEAWQTDRARLEGVGSAAIEQMRQAGGAGGGRPKSVGSDAIDRAMAEWKSAFDPDRGGFGGAPKFPQPRILSFLVKAGRLREDAEALDMAVTTLRHIARGGIRDQIGGAFHRYAVDARWHVPHFEIMLYDQALLADAFLEGYRATGDEEFADAVHGILEDVSRRLTGPDGNFFSALDADSPEWRTASEKKEGAFYLWTYGEVLEALGDPLAPIAIDRFGIRPEGNARDDPHGEFQGKNILFQARTVAETAARFGLTEAGARAALARARDRLRQVRGQRPAPALDDKSLTSWNAMMISSFASAGRVLGTPHYVSIATRAADFVLKHLVDAKSGDILRRFRDGRAGIEGGAEDVALLIRALLDLYEAGGEIRFLQRAFDWQARLDRTFLDEGRGGYFDTSGRDPTVLLRLKTGADHVIPSPNGVSARNVQRLAHISGDPALAHRAERVVAAFANEMERSPSAFPSLLEAVLAAERPPSHAVIAAAAAREDARALLEAVFRHRPPFTAVLHADGGEGQAWLAERMPVFTAIASGGDVAVSLCDNASCSRPVTSPGDVAALWRERDER